MIFSRSVGSIYKMEQYKGATEVFDIDLPVNLKLLVLEYADLFRRGQKTISWTLYI